MPHQDNHSPSTPSVVDALPTARRALQVQIAAPIGGGVAHLAPGTFGPTWRGGEGPESSSSANQLLPLAEVGDMATLIELTKPRITRLVTLTSAVGFVLGIVGQKWTAMELATTAGGCLAGTALSAAGANALNQWWERERDALMHRTASRPLPTRRMTMRTAWMAGVGLSIAGVALLWLTCGAAAALVSLATILIYVLVYTPMKTVTPLATLVGAVPGALPPLIGWCAAIGLGARHIESFDQWAGLRTAGGWSLFALMMVWQIPHFLAIAWMHKEDYARGGHAVLPVYDESGARTAAVVLIGALLLLPVTVAPALLLPDRLSWPYGTVAALSGLAFIWCCAELMRERTRDKARRVFLASIMHLPLLLFAIVAEVIVRAML